MSDEPVYHRSAVAALAEKEEEKWQGAALRTVSQLKGWLELTGKVIRQTEAVLRGERHLPQRLASILDPGARPIIRGKARTPVEFGRKVLFGETERGIITTYQVYKIRAIIIDNFLGMS